jgi:signal transduction histidine kinase
MAKGISISLAAKCQLLFGLAVLVIIAGALAVPWQRMEQLAGQQNVKAARMLADSTFRQVHVNAPPGPARALPETAGPTTAPNSATRPGNADLIARWRDSALVDTIDYPPPRIITLSALQDTLPNEDEVIRHAVELFRDHPLDTQYGRVITVGREKSRVYRFAAAIRLDHSCLPCHEPWTSWVRAVPAAGPASSSSPTASGVPASWPLVGVVQVDLPWQIDDSQLLLNRIVIAVAGMLGGTLAIVVFYLITSRLILQPVRVLKNTAEKVSRGDLNIRSAISTGDEFQQLSETFNRMLATLSASQTQLEATNRSLDTRVGELAQSNVDLYEANRLKSEFLTNVSHELRTPLNAIIGFTDLLAENPATKQDAKLARYVENIKIPAKQLLDLINDLLDLAKIEAGKLVLRPEKVNVTDVCEALTNFMRPLAQKKNIDLSFSLSETLPLITTDPGRFQQILYNFLSNAIKFTPNDGQVRLAAKSEDLPSGPGVRVSVTDTGPGIAPEHQQEIFEKFRQLDGSVTRQHSGSGLGLAISRDLAEMLGARIELISALGKGATFALILPIEMSPREVDIHNNNAAPTLPGPNGAPPVIW